MGSSYLIILIVLMFVLMYFMVMRPQKKQMDRQREMLNQMSEGTRIMLTSGLFGTVRATGESQAVIELAPGVDITVLKQAISKIVRPEDEEFEFADDADQDAEGESPAEEAGTPQEESAGAESTEASETVEEAEAPEGADSTTQSTNDAGPDDREAAEPDTADTKQN